MDASKLVNAMIVFYADHRDNNAIFLDREDGRRAGQRSVGMGNMLTYAAMVAWQVDEQTAVEVIGERLLDIRADRG